MTVIKNPKVMQWYTVWHVYAVHTLHTKLVTLDAHIYEFSINTEGDQTGLKNAGSLALIGLSTLRFSERYVMVLKLVYILYFIDITLRQPSSSKQLLFLRLLYNIPYPRRRGGNKQDDTLQEYVIFVM